METGDGNSTLHLAPRTLAQTFEAEVTAGKRFEFGKNWQRFLSVLDNERIAEAGRSLRDMLGVEDLRGKSFLDIGSGSGLFSLAAMRLGAERAHSLDYDPQSVACTLELKRRYFGEAENWTVEQGSALDSEYLARLGQWDIVYSWGVLHHTGDMWKALGNVVPLVRPGGQLFISIYNDQGFFSRAWRKVKVLYNRSRVSKALVAAVFIPYFVLRGFAVDLLRRRNPLKAYTEYKKSRGMSRVHDWFDWLGGYPFEVAKPEEIFDFFHKRGFELEHITTCQGGLGCNQFVFTRR
jgi:2-polyprenyl-3-methyl-5-hydroxy-6-metoxy-1,4-benzoquinol methylase